MCEVELDFWSWVGKVNEKLTFIRLKVSNHEDRISEEDWALLEMLHRPYFNGEMPIYQSKLDLLPEKSVQVGLFDSNTGKDSSGTDLAIPPVN